MSLKQFGGKVTKELKEQYSKSDNWREGKFMNLETTTMDFHFQELPKLMYKQFFEKKDREPKQKLPIKPFDKEAFLAPSDKMKFVWFGHSAVLMRLNGLTILVDPMLGPDSSPIGPFRTKRFSDGTLEIIDQFPEIDLLLLTHDHYDHLDLASIDKLKSKVKNYYVAIGTARHLIKWGVLKEVITEFDWWDSQKFKTIDITFTPSRHFSGRGINDRSKSLWGGWVLKTDTENIYWSGDGGYGKHFQEIGNKLGPFDFAFMECGQYNKSWHQIHMYPEESIQASIDVKANNRTAVHWGGFSLAQHSWKEPIERFCTEGVKKNCNIITPELGELIDNYQVYQSKNWWESI